MTLQSMQQLLLLVVVGGASVLVLAGRTSSCVTDAAFMICRQHRHHQSEGVRLWAFAPNLPSRARGGRFLLCSGSTSLHSSTTQEADERPISIIPDELKDLLDIHGGFDWRSDNCMIVPIAGDAAFCNQVYRITRRGGHDSTTTVIAKIFSQLALRRMDPCRNVGEIDRIVASHGLGPNILASTASGILMEQCEGAVYTEDMVHQTPSPECLAHAADAFARLHQITVVAPNTTAATTTAITPHPKRNNMLWYSCEVMLSMTNDDRFDVAGGWSLDRLQQAVKHHRDEVEALQLPVVDCGHGDAKVSNLMIANNGGGVQFIDFELTGSNYRGYDLAKLFRIKKPTAFTDRNRVDFFKAYAEVSRDLFGKQIDPNRLAYEAEVMLPLTWLEPVLFFACMASLDISRSVHWNKLAQDRIECYERCVDNS